MLITDLRATKRGKISVYIDGEFACVLHPDVAASAGLVSDSEISAERLGDLAAMSREKLAREQAIGLLSARAYTAKALRDKLAVRTDPDSAQAAVERMEELGLVDDADYARRFAADCVIKGYSLRRTAFTLREKGIERSVIEQTLAELAFNPEQSIARILMRKHPRWFEDEKSRQRAINALVRLGYDYGDIRTVMRNLEEDSDYYADENED